MSKKLWIAGLVALVAVVAVAGAAVAATGDGHPGGPNGPRSGDQQGQGRHRIPKAIGEVTSIGDDEFTMLTRSDLEITALVDADTSYKDDLEAFEDLEVGMTIGAAGLREGEATFLAKVLFSGERLEDFRRAHGEVSEVGSSSLTIENREGESLTFEVNDDTVFKSRDGEVESLSDIEEGDPIVVGYLVEENGDLLAKVIGVGHPKAERDQQG